MKKLFITAAGALMIASCSSHKQDNNTESEEIDTTATIDSVAGQFDVRDFGSYKLHIYLTGDQMGDASFIIEGQDSLITLEQPLFKVNAQTYDNYLATLGKPVAKRIADFHLGNTGDATIIMPEGMPEVVNGPAYSGMMKHFEQEYGDAIEPLPTGATEEVAFNSTVNFGGVSFTFLKGANNDFPAANILIGNDVVYSHWAPAKAHINTLYASNAEGIVARIAELEQNLSTGATVFVGGHGMPGTVEDVKFMIGYLNKINQLLSSAADAETFASSLIETYPGLPGEDGIKALAEALYTTK